MGLSGVSGPFSGAYQTWNVSVATVFTATNGRPIWAYRVATGMDLTIYNVQAFCTEGGNGTTVDVFDDGSTILTAAIGLATATYRVGALATPLGVPVAERSIITASIFNGTGATPEGVVLTILWAPTGNTHPSSVRSAFE